MPQMVISVKDKSFLTPDTFMELSRTVDGFLFDEVVIKEIKFVPSGREVHFSYRRNGKTIPSKFPLQVSAVEFRAAAIEAKKEGSHFGNTSVAQKLFADGARQYTADHAPAVEDAIADMQFIDELTDGTTS